jgi:hypothetical protein
MKRCVSRYLEFRTKDNFKDPVFLSVLHLIQNLLDSIITYYPRHICRQVIILESLNSSSQNSKFSRHVPIFVKIGQK